MAKHNVTYKCGHTKMLEIFNENKLEQTLTKFKESICPECKRDALFEEISNYEKEKSLPIILGGSEKQINWARKIRYDLLKSLDYQIKKRIDYLRNNDQDKSVAEKKADEFLGLFYSQDKAFWWIDRKNIDLYSISERKNMGFYKYCRDPESFIKNWGFISVRIEDMIDKKEALVLYPVPEKEKTKTICHIYSNSTESMIYVESQKDQTIIDIFHSILGMRWNRELNMWQYKWGTKIYDTTTFDDMIVYIGYKMFSNGVPVTVDREDLYDKITNGDFQRRCYHWLAAIKDNNIEVTYINYKNFDKDKVEKLRSLIKNITYNGRDKEKYSYTIKARYYEKLREWCEECNVKISPAADEILKQAENRKQRRRKT